MLLKAYKGELVIMQDDGLTLSGVKGSSKRGKVFAPINIQSELPVRKSPCEEEICMAMPVVSDGNTNLSPAEKELLRWHQRLGHIAFKKMQHLMKSRVLAHSEATCGLHSIACRLPPVKCAVCQYAKQRVSSSPGTVTNAIQNHRGLLSQGNLFP